MDKELIFALKNYKNERRGVIWYLIIASMLNLVVVYFPLFVEDQFTLAEIILIVIGAVLFYYFVLLLIKYSVNSLKSTVISFEFISNEFVATIPKLVGSEKIQFGLDDIIEVKRNSHLIKNYKLLWGIWSFVMMFARQVGSTKPAIYAKPFYVYIKSRKLPLVFIAKGEVYNKTLFTKVTGFSF